MGSYSTSQWVLASGAIVAIAGTWAAIINISLVRYGDKLYIMILVQVTLNAFKAGREVYWDDMRELYKAEIPWGSLTPKEAREALAEAERLLPGNAHGRMYQEKAFAATRRSIPKGDEPNREYWFVANLMFWQIVSMFGLRSCMLSSAPSTLGITLSMIGILIVSTVFIGGCLITTKYVLRGRSRVKQLCGNPKAN